MIKKLFYMVSLVFVIVLCFSFTAFAYEHEDFYKGSEGTTLNVFNWGEYISEFYEDGLINVNKEFEKLTGIKVNYVTFESNEDMYAKIKNGGSSYDIIVPSDYMIGRMIEEKMLRTFDAKSLPNYHYISDDYKGMYYDPDECYSVPYNVGMVGLIYNSRIVKEKPTSWKILWDERYAGQILMIDNSRDAFMVPEKILGYSLNTTDEKELGDVAQMLIDQKPLLQSYVMDEVYNKLESGEAAMCPYYVGDYISMKENNPDLAFCYPEEGTNIFVDAMCIPADCRNYEGALKYINFMMDPVVALSNAWVIGYASPNTSVLEDPDYAEELGSDEYLYPSDENMPDVEYYYNLPQETLMMFAELWNEIKVSGSSNTHIYIGFGVVAAIIAGGAIYGFVIKRKREYWYDHSE